MNDIYRTNRRDDVLSGNTYPGRGIVMGLSPDGRSAVGAYFIMGRSENSRNRVFSVRDGSVFTKPFDPSRVEDPSLIIYAAVRDLGERLIITNGDQTDTVYEGIISGGTFESALAGREFEPDAPNFTPRISGMMTASGSEVSYEMSILKSADAEGSACARYRFVYPALRGVGHLIHTYEHDGDPLPTFRGEPRRIAIPDSIDEFTESLWGSLDADNRISLYVRYTDTLSGNVEYRVINKNTK